MWQVIAAVFAALVGFGSGTTGLGGGGQNVPITPYSINACYQPRPDIRFTIKWPDNFVDVPDPRGTLNPAVFGSKPPTFNTENACYPMLLRDTNGLQLDSRNYIRVRENVRIASCKTDELAGPYNTDGKSCHDRSIEAALLWRGTCNISGYNDLRKVAQVNRNGENLEIFWNPSSHNVACNYNPDTPNCGPDSRGVINLREFLYVLKKRDAFDPSNPAKCKVLWDAGNKEACSHYYDVYMAEDFYNKIQNPVPTGDPDYQTYQFYKEVILNCKEQNTFSPIIDVPGLTFPPTFIEMPFVASNFFVQQPNKITPRDDYELFNYQYFISSSPVINPFITNLVQIVKSTTPLNICLPGQFHVADVGPSLTPTPVLTSPPSCYLPIGSVTFQKDTNSYVTFKVYSLYDTPQTFSFVDESGTDTTVYQYTITDQVQQVNTAHFPALQLKALEFGTENLWTWATPHCKPAIYLYPEKITDLNVKLEVDGKITASNPFYDPLNGWNIRAFPDGKLVNWKSGKLGNLSYPYLFYESQVLGLKIPKEGWVVEKGDLKRQISNIMSEIGFNQQEISDFLSYWIPKLTEKPYYFITLLPEDLINEKEKLTFSQKPETLIRARFIFEGLDTPLRVEPLKEVTRHQRKGFVATDWGGSVVGKSCTNVEMK